MIAAEDTSLTLEQAAEWLGFTHKHRKRTVVRLASKGLVITDYGHRTKRVAMLDLIKFNTKQKALEKAGRRK